MDAILCVFKWLIAFCFDIGIGSLNFIYIYHQQ